MATVKSTTAGIMFPTTGPRARDGSFRVGGDVRASRSNVTTLAAEPDTSNLIFCPFPSHARVKAVLLSAADATTAGAIDIGVWKRNAADDDWEAVDDDLFASALALTGGPFNNSDVTWESGEYTVAEAELPIWQVLGLTSDPNIIYWIGADVTTTFDGGPTVIGIEVEYVE